MRSTKTFLETKEQRIMIVIAIMEIPILFLEISLNSSTRCVKIEKNLKENSTKNELNV